MTFEIMKGWSPKFSSIEFAGRSVSEIDRVISRRVRGRLVGIKICQSYEDIIRTLPKFLEKVASKLGCSTSDISAESLSFATSTLYIKLNLKAWKSALRSDATKAWEVARKRELAVIKKQKLLKTRMVTMRKLKYARSRATDNFFAKD
jgi:hypothetical protein